METLTKLRADKKRALKNSKQQERRLMKKGASRMRVMPEIWQIRAMAIQAKISDLTRQTSLS